MKRRMPVSIITGFLGAGKTSLLNHIFQKYPEKRFAVIENEFGDIGIDSALLKTKNQGNIFELSEGCICCSINDELAETLGELALVGDKFEHLLIETTGIADPASVVQTLLNNHALAGEFMLDAIICLVDVQNIDKQIEENSEAGKQIVLADLIVLNKTDTISPEKLTKIEAKITAINAHALVVTANYGQINMDNILNLNSFDSQLVAQQTMHEAKLDSHSPEKHQITSYSLQIEGSFNADRFLFWMEYFLSLNSQNLYRSKGILSFEDRPEKIIFQSVGNAYSIDSGDYWSYNEVRSNQLVFIGKDIDKKAIKQALHYLIDGQLEAGVNESKKD